MSHSLVRKLKARVLPRFPTGIEGTGGIVAEYVNGRLRLSLSPDFSPPPPTDFTLGDIADVGSATPTKGNLLVGNGATWEAIGVGSNDHVLTADSSETLGVKWAEQAGGGGTLVNAYGHFTDGTNTANSNDDDTFKFRGGTGVTVTVGDNDVTHGDNLLISLNGAQVGSLIELGNLSDVNVPSPTDGYVLTWNNTAGEWQAAEGTAGPQGDPGTNGDDGWAPVLAVVADDARRVLQVVDWTGGTGTEPATGDYIGATGLVSDIGDGVDISGAAIDVEDIVNTVTTYVDERIAEIPDPVAMAIVFGG